MENQRPYNPAGVHIGETQQICCHSVPQVHARSSERGAAYSEGLRSRSRQPAGRGEANFYHTQRACYTRRAAEALLRNADAEDMQNLTQSEYEVLVSRLSRKSESGVSNAHDSAAATAAAAYGSSSAAISGQVEEPYVFDVFLTLITGVAQEDASDFVECVSRFFHHWRVHTAAARGSQSFQGA